MQTIHHKRNEKQEVEFFQDKECTKLFDFTNAKDLYIELRDGDITPLMELSAIVEDCNIYIPFLQKIKYYTLSAISFALSENRNILYILSETAKFTDATFYNSILENIKTLNDITPNLSKYIPEDNVVLFLSEEDYNEYRICFPSRPADLFSEYIFPNIKYTIFLPHGTQAGLEKVNEVGKELKEKYGVNKVGVFVSRCFTHADEIFKKILFRCKWKEWDEWKNYETSYGGVPTAIDIVSINKIITTNSTGILRPQNSERLQVIDCKEMFEEALKENN